VDFLQSAKARGIRLGLLSDYPAANKLAAMGLDGCVAVLIVLFSAAVGFSTGVLLEAGYGWWRNRKRPSVLL
jgi:hypothetical protein